MVEPEKQVKKALELPSINHAGVLVMKNGQIINYGVIKYKDGYMFSYSQEHMLKMHRYDLSEDDRTIEQKIEDGDILKINIEDIKQVTF
jgi:hypothetical protein